MFSDLIPVGLVLGGDQRQDHLNTRRRLSDAREGKRKLAVIEIGRNADGIRILQQQHRRLRTGSRRIALADA